MFNFAALAAPQFRYNCSMATARKFLDICSAIGLNHPRIFIEPNPGIAGANGTWLIPEKADKGDSARWDADSHQIDTTGMDLQQLWAGDDPGDSEMYIFGVVDESDDPFTIAPTMTALTDPKRLSQRAQILIGFLHQVAIGGKLNADGLVDRLKTDPSVLQQVNTILAR